MPRMANTYLIQRGDTLSKVAAMHHTTVKELLSLNPEIKNPDLIFAGTTIKVPAKAADTDTDSVSSSGVIQEIAKAYATTADKLLCIKPELINANVLGTGVQPVVAVEKDRKSTRLNSSHVRISYAVFCLKKKKKNR